MGFSQSRCKGVLKAALLSAGGAVAALGGGPLFIAERSHCAARLFGV